LLNWIINEVIGKRHARGFLLSSNVNDKLIDFLYDSRILHILKQGVSGKTFPGKRFNVYSLDYGCYVDLLSTKKAPLCLLHEEDEGGQEIELNVPKTDLRSIRNSILDLEKYYTQSLADSQQDKIGVQAEIY